MRATFIRTLVELAEEDERIVLLTGDLGFTVVEPFAERFPDRFFNVGVAEQNMLGVATGLAEAGFVPFAYSIATFATLRSYEFVRNGPVLHHLPVRIVGVGGGLEYGMNGLTHYALEDIAVMRTQPGMTVLAPADFRAGSDGADRETETVPGPIYFRLGKNETETVPGLDGRLRLDGVEQIGAGRDVAIVTTGSIAHEAAAAVELLEAQGWRSRLVVAACLSPLAHEGARHRAAKRPRSWSRWRRTTSSGGLGSLVSEVVAESGLGCRVVRCGVAGLPDSVGSEAFLNEAHGLSASGDRTSRRIEALDRARPYREHGRRPMKKLSAVIACYRDAPAIPEMYARLTETFRSIGVDYEIIFVNDASPDNAREVLAELAASDPRVVVVNHTRNFGSQSAFTSGMRIATGDAAILLDGDLQDPPELIAEFHEKWLEG